MEFLTTFEKGNVSTTDHDSRCVGWSLCWPVRHSRMSGHDHHGSKGGGGFFLTAEVPEVVECVPLPPEMIKST